jgi:chemotaxis protein CheD
MISETPYLVETILGSCISVTFWDCKHHYGGMNHFMLPTWTGRGLPSPKYGDVAINELLQTMYSMGSRRENIVARVYGGCQSIKSSELFNIGKRNAELAFHFLKKEDISIVHQNIGGDFGRRLTFNSKNGEVDLKYIILELKSH